DDGGLLALPDDPRVRRNSILTTANLPPQPDPAPMIIPDQRDEVVIQKEGDMMYHATQRPQTFGDDDTDDVLQKGDHTKCDNTEKPITPNAEEPSIKVTNTCAESDRT
ncbi:hypothetical protein SARC_14275, partial [Sphaeroforma arctica JP610]